MKTAEPALQLELLRAELKAERRARAMAEQRLSDAFRQRLMAPADMASASHAVPEPHAGGPSSGPLVPLLRDLRSALSSARMLAAMPSLDRDVAADLATVLDRAQLRADVALDLLHPVAAPSSHGDNEVHLGALLMEVDDEARDRAEALGVTWSMQLHLPLPTRLKGDAKRWRRLVQVLADGAIDAVRAARPPRDERGPVLQARADADMLVLHGPVGDGTDGAVMPLARSLGAQLQAAGGTFTLTLPVGATAGPWPVERHAWDRAARAACAAASTGPRAPRLSGSVLLADGAALRRRLLGRLVQSTGATVTEVDDGPALVAAALSGDHDLLLVAGTLPGLDGASAVRLVREAGHGGAILGYAGCGTPTDGNGCDAVWPDPDDHADLLQRLARLLPTADAPAASAGSAADSAWLDALVGRLADDFCREWPQRQAELRAACAQRDAAALKRLAHRVRGVAGSIGFMHLSTLAEPVQQAAEDGRLDEAIALAQRLIDTTPLCRAADESLT